MIESGCPELKKSSSEKFKGSDQEKVFGEIGKSEGSWFLIKRGFDLD